MTVDKFLWNFVKWGTPVTVVDRKNNPIDSFTYDGTQCAWKGNWEIKECTIEEERLIIKTREY